MGTWSIVCIVVAAVAIIAVVILKKGK